MHITRRKNLAMLAATPLVVGATGGTLTYSRVKIYEAENIITMEPANPSA
ncbi:MAG: hypothetical protein RL481_9, partial [Pseudomonadota bacterium]